MKFRPAFLAIIGVYLASWLVVLLKIWPRIEYVDVPLHIAGGIAQGMLAVALIRASKVSNRPWWFDLLFVTGFVMLMGSSWEVFEWIQEHFLIHAQFYLPMTLRDTLGDLFNDGLGALISWYIFIWRDNK